jgi:hypothetical protein
MIIHDQCSYLPARIAEQELVEIRRSPERSLILKQQAAFLLDGWQKALRELCEQPRQRDLKSHGVVEYLKIAGRRLA